MHPHDLISGDGKEAEGIVLSQVRLTGSGKL